MVKAKSWFVCATLTITLLRSIHKKYSSESLSYNFP